MMDKNEGGGVWEKAGEKINMLFTYSVLHGWLAYVRTCTLSYDSADLSMIFI